MHNLPLVARNPYNFALVQPGVTGIENVEFGVPRLAANGASMRINYMIDGNTNTEKDRAGLRLLPMSEVMIQEVKVVTTGFAPEFGQTMGMVYNAVTPSGTNTFQGEGSYLFRRNPFSAFPFFFGCGSTTPAANCPAIAAVRRPATSRARHQGRHRHRGRRRPDHQEQAVLLRRLGADAPRPVVDQPDHGRRRRSSRRSASSRSRPPRPNVQTGKFAIGKGDYQINGNNRLTARWIRFHNDAPYNSGGGTATLERATNFLDAMDSSAAQLVSSLGSNKLNEFRFQYAHRHQSSVANSRFRHRPGGHDQHAVDRVRRPGRRHRPGQRRLRLQAEHHRR